MKISIIGAGSPYTPEMIGKLAQEQNELPVDEICLMDIDQDRLDIMYDFCLRYGKHLGLNASITKTVDRKQALINADFVNTQIRVGGNKCRVLDEKIPLSHGLIGQETTGAGGFTKCLRTIPAMLEIARDVEIICPDAWIVNYANPTGLVTEAVFKYTTAKIAGLCAGGFHAQTCTASALNVPVESVRYDLIGLNHLNFAYNITVAGKSVTDDEFAIIAEASSGADKDLYIMLGAISIGYLSYYFHTASMVKKMSEAPKTRGEQVMELEIDVFKDFADPGCNTRPESLNKRGGGGYSDCTVAVIKAIYLNRDTWTVANVPNRGAVKFLPDDTVIETPCLVNASGFHPLAQPSPPKAVWGLISAVKNYEQLAVEAAVTGSRETALLALIAHPLVGDYDIAQKLLPDLLEQNKIYLPQFF